MPSQVDSIKSEIDDLDFEIFGEPWTIGSFPNIQCIKEEFQDEFDGIWHSVIELQVKKSLLPSDLQEDMICTRESDSKSFRIRRILPEIEGNYVFTVTEVK